MNEAAPTHTLAAERRIVTHCAAANRTLARLWSSSGQRVGRLSRGGGWPECVYMAASNCMTLAVCGKQ